MATTSLNHFWDGFLLIDCREQCGASPFCFLLFFQLSDFFFDLFELLSGYIACVKWVCMLLCVGVIDPLCVCVLVVPLCPLVLDFVLQ